jgi:hypothetical protein
MTTSIIGVVVASAVLWGASIASAQVSSGSPEAAQQNFAKKPTDNGEHNPKRPDTDFAKKSTDPAEPNMQESVTSGEKKSHSVR